MDTKRLTNYALFTAFGLILAYIESLIPFFFGVFGMKLGLANSLVVIMLYTEGAGPALLVNTLRILLAGFMFGNPFSIIYSLCGGMLSLAVMLFIRNTGLFTIATTSMMGGLFHNIGQLAVASFVMESFNIFWYAPVLMIAGAVTGTLVGIISTELIIRVKKI